MLASSLAVGLSGSGRLHDLFVNCEGVTPGEYRSAGEGLEILYGVHHSPFGYCFIAQTQRGACKLSFFDQADDDNALTELQQEWPNASVHQNSETTHATFMRLFPSENSDAPLAVATTPLKLLLKGSPFQLQVWEALLTVPSGSMRSYQHIADTMGKPSAKFSSDKKTKIESRLNDGFTCDNLKNAISGCAQSDYHMGRNPSGKLYNSIDLIFQAQR